MRNLSNRYVYKDTSYGRIRIYQDFCIDCGKEKWVKISKIGKRCRACSHIGIINTQKKVNCKYKNCIKEILPQTIYCKTHKRLMVDRYKIEARWKVMNAVASGKLIKDKCLHCESIKTEAHHPNYRNPLYVIWLCRSHHQEIHGGRFQKI